MGLKKSLGLGAIAAAALLAVPALARAESNTERKAERIYHENTQPRGITNDLGVSVSGGINGYTGRLGDDTGAGGFLGVQADSRPFPILGVELGYEGSRNPFENINGALWRHTVGALAKVGPELGRDGNLRPFVGAGVGVGTLHPSGDAKVLYDNDFISEVPLALGVDYKFGAVRAGARATYRILGGENLGAAQTGNDLNLGINLGGAF